MLFKNIDETYISSPIDWQAFSRTCNTHRRSAAVITAIIITPAIIAVTTEATTITTTIIIATTVRLLLNAATIPLRLGMHEIS